MKRLFVVSLVATLPAAACVAPPPTPAFQVTLRLSPTPALIGPTRLIIDVASITVTDNAGVSLTRSFPISVYGGS